MTKTDGKICSVQREILLMFLENKRVNINLKGNRKEKNPKHAVSNEM
jgi:hypothetical protein